MRIRVRVDSRTKDVIGRCRAGEAVLVSHADMDAVAAEALVEAEVRAVLNARSFVSGRYPARGAEVLLAAGVLLVEDLGEQCLERIADGDAVDLVGPELWHGGTLVAVGRILTTAACRERLVLAERRLGEALPDFVANTLAHALAEADRVLAPLPALPQDLGLTGRTALLVARGPDYLADLGMLLPFIRSERPALIAIDGGATALRRHHLRPDLIVGDMDSVDDATLRACPRRVVHAYPDGFSPGLLRCRRLGLPATVVAAAGTSEDLALRLAYDAGARPLVLVGAHTGLTDFLDKGRPGMASTLLVRLKVGHALIDAKGARMLYRPRHLRHYLAALIGAALLPAALLCYLAPAAHSLLALWVMQAQVRFP